MCVCLAFYQAHWWNCIYQAKGANQSTKKSALLSELKSAHIDNIPHESQF